MTFSLLMQDTETAAIEGAVLTAGLCVGGYVLHGAAGLGFIVTQGFSTNVLSGQNGLLTFADGADAAQVCSAFIAADPGRERRQLGIIDWNGRTAAYTGRYNDAWGDRREQVGPIVAGDRLTGASVLETMATAAADANGTIDELLLAALEAGSAALNVCAPDTPSLDLRAGHGPAPLQQLRELRAACRTPNHFAFLSRLPRMTDRGRA